MAVPFHWAVENVQWKKLPLTGESVNDTVLPPYRLGHFVPLTKKKVLTFLHNLQPLGNLKYLKKCII